MNLSMIPAAQADSPSPAARQHWLSERVFDWAGVGAVHLRAAFFYENLIRFAAESVAKEGRISLPFGNGDRSIAWVGVRDVARVAAAILANPTSHLGQTYYVTGPEALSARQVAKRFSTALNRPVEYADIPLERWQQELVHLEGPNPYLIEHLSTLSLALKAGKGFGQATETTRAITHQEPEMLAEFVLRNTAVFGQK